MFLLEECIMKQTKRIIIMTLFAMITMISTVLGYTGNMNTGKFHYDDCRHVSRMNEINKIYFDTRTEAINSGYVPCGTCHP